MITARAVTGQDGLIRVGGGDLLVSKIPMYATRSDERMPDKSFADVDHLDELLRNSYNLLAFYIINKLGVDVYTMVHYGKKGTVRWIKLDGKTYWSRGRSIHDYNK